MESHSMNYYLQVACAIVSLLSILNSFANNKDVFSPVKTFSLFNIFFYFDVYLNYYNDIVLMMYLLQCLLIFIISFVEPKVSKLNLIKIKSINSNKVIILVWCLSSLSILNQLIAIYELGGIYQYMANISNRVLYYKGRGYIPILNAFISILNVIYLIAIIASKKRSKLKLLLYILHFLIFSFMSLLSGSRSAFLMTLLFHIYIYNYTCKPISIKSVSILFLTLVTSAMILGGIRNSISSEGEINTNSEEITFEFSILKYGLIPLDIITTSELKPIHYGMTYASLVTNFIPRFIYPNKLDTGGLVFTKEYADNLWGGASNLATGAITEGVINFGYTFGVPLGLLLIGMFFLFGIKLYRKFLNKKELTYEFLIIYICLVLLFSRFSYGDFGYVLFNPVLTVFIPILIVSYLEKLKLIKF